MLWSLHKTQGCPNSQLITQAVCTAYSLGSCSSPLPFSVSTCTTPSPGPSPSPAPPGSCSSYAGPGGNCGSAYGGVCCQSGQCCSQVGPRGLLCVVGHVAAAAAVIALHAGR
jgi:hypothetical protein